MNQFRNHSDTMLRRRLSSSLENYMTILIGDLDRSNSPGILLPCSIGTEHKGFSAVSSSPQSALIGSCVELRLYMTRGILQAGVRVRRRGVMIKEERSSKIMHKQVPDDG